METCPGCGTREDEWADDRFAFVGHSWQCRGCEIKEQERENNVPEDEKGWHVGILPRGVFERVQREKDEAEQRLREQQHHHQTHHAGVTEE